MRKDLPVATRSLTPIQRRAARLLGRGFSQPEVARRCSIGTRTIRYWMEKNPDFRRAAQAAQEEIGEPTAIETLRELLTDPNSSIRLGAARALLLAPPGSEDPGGPAATPAGGGTVNFHILKNPDGTIELVDPPPEDETSVSEETEVARPADASAPQTVYETEHLPG